jgi:mRNA interferase HigB
MAMRVRNAAVLIPAGRKNKPLRAALDHWLVTAEAATWSNLQDVRKTFASADGVIVNTDGGIQVIATVFNIKGNQYRLITVVNYRAASVLVREILTHAEHSKGRWKDRL